jgi:alkyldihydroxyacetonephosphate synthase
MTKSSFIPQWRETAPEEMTYRSVFKWGDPLGFKHPNDRLFEAMKETFHMTDDEFKSKNTEGNEKIECKQDIVLDEKHIKAFTDIVGEENISTVGYDRVKYSAGKTAEESLRMRKGEMLKVSDAVLHPKDKGDVRKIVAYCNENKIPIYVFGGGSSVNFGLMPSKGGVTLVMMTHMNKIVKFNETNQTVTVEAGMMGPAFEEMLNKAPEKFNAKRKYTCGHFPQSFEYSSVGGWVVTLGSGQASSYYGDAGDLVISQEYITPAGEFKTREFPATATGPKVNDIMKGSEGTFGVLVECTMKIFRHMPENRQNFAFIFPSRDAAVEAAKEVTQAEFGMPAVFRISDPEETDIGLKLYGVEGTILDTAIKLFGYKPMERCLCLGFSEGEKKFAKNVKKQVRKICKKHGAMYITGYPLKNWEHGRYADPYMREDLNDYGIVIDTLESGVSWDQLHDVHQKVRAFVKSRPGTICMTHASHFYPQGTNLYFIFIGKMDDVAEYKKFQDGIIDHINESGGSLSHHHGVGKMIGPWMEKHLGKEQMVVLRAI